MPWLPHPAGGLIQGAGASRLPHKRTSNSLWETLCLLLSLAKIYYEKALAEALFKSKDELQYSLQ